jgi:hypothetical protein
VQVYCIPQLAITIFDCWNHPSLPLSRYSFSLGVGVFAESDLSKMGSKMHEEIHRLQVNVIKII